MAQLQAQILEAERLHNFNLFFSQAILLILPYQTILKAECFSGARPQQYGVVWWTSGQPLVIFYSVYTTTGGPPDSCSPEVHSDPYFNLDLLTNEFQQGPSLRRTHEKSFLRASGK